MIPDADQKRALAEAADRIKALEARVKELEDLLATVMEESRLAALSRRD